MGLHSESDGKVKGSALRAGEECGLGLTRWGLGAADTPRYQLRREVMTKKRMAWLEPCFSTVAVRPWYVPFSPGGRQEWRLHLHTGPSGDWGKLHTGGPRQKEEGPLHSG